MNVYLLSHDRYALDPSLLALVRASGLQQETISYPDNHEDIATLFAGREGGIVFLPASWADLMSVKILQELECLGIPFESIMVGPVPETRQLIMAFNEGMTAYLPTPVRKEEFDLALRRAVLRFEKRNQDLYELSRLRLLEQQNAGEQGGAMVNQSARNYFLGKAFVDTVNRTGPINKGEVEILFVSSSSAQRGQLEQLLKVIGIHVNECHTIAEAKKKVANTGVAVIISDNILSDGSATQLSREIRKVCTKIPKLIVWSSNPEKIPELLKPENFIDEVILKTALDKGAESLLPSILAWIYQY